MSYFNVSGVEESMATMSKTTSVGIVGYGYWGQILSKNVSQAAGVSMDCVCDAAEGNLKVAEREHTDVRTFTNLDDFLADADLDVVIIATPARTHYPLCLLYTSPSPRDA